MRLKDKATGQCLCEYELEEQPLEERERCSSVVMCRVFRQKLGPRCGRTYFGESLREWTCGPGLPSKQWHPPSRTSSYLASWDLAGGCVHGFSIQFCRCNALHAACICTFRRCRRHSGRYDAAQHLGLEQGTCCELVNVAKRVLLTLMRVAQGRALGGGGYWSHGPGAPPCLPRISATWVVDGSPSPDCIGSLPSVDSVNSHTPCSLALFLAWIGDLPAAY